MHPEATRNHYYQPLIASYHYLATITSFKSLFLNFGNFEPVYHWSRWVFISGRSVHSGSLSCGSATSDSRYQGLAVEFQDYWAGLTSKSLGGSSGSSGRTSNPGLFALEGSTTSDSRYQAIDFQDVWTCLALKSLSEEEKHLPLSAVSADIHLLPKQKDLFGSSLRGWIFEFRQFCTGLTSKSLSGISGISVQSSHISSGITTRNSNFKTFEPVQHQSRSVESVEEASSLGMFPLQLST